MNFVQDLNADSLDGVELMMTMEDVFGISIPDEENERFLTVQIMIDYIINGILDSENNSSK